MNIAKLILFFLAPKARSFERATANPSRAQEKILIEYLRRNRRTEYGRKYNFSSIRSISDYRSLVPLSDCETMRPYLERMAAGEADILTVDSPVFFGATSGTTSRRKYIPMTKYSESKKADVTALWSYYICRDHPDVLKKKVLAIVSTEVEGYTKSGIPFGGESGRGYKELPAIVKHMYALPYRVFDIMDYDARYYSILRISMECDITNITTLNPNTLSLLCQKIEKWQESIITDIEKGSLSENFDIPRDIRSDITRTLKPNPERADELRSILKEKGRLLPKYFWPRLELLECWKGGSMNIYLKELAISFGDVPVRDIGCLSTETRSSIPVSDAGAGGVLAIETNFYEFIPREDIGKKDKRILLCDEVEAGKDYFIIVTTPGGLYRYDIDDIVHINGFFNRTPVIEFVQKGSSAVSLAGEKLYESQVNEALKSVLDKNKILIEFFSAVGERTIPPHYVFLVEFSEPGPSADKKKVFLKEMEEALRDKNKEYEYVRQAQLMAPPEMKVVKSGGFENYKIKKLHEGAHDSQFKIPEVLLSEDFDKNFPIAEEIGL